MIAMPATHDIAIIGAGPAGAVCALLLARHGHTVLLIDKEPFPRHKACGDLFIPDSLMALKRLDLLERVEKQAHRLDAIRVYSPSQYAFDIRSEYLAMKRYDFDHILVQAAQRAGAVLTQSHIVDIRSDKEKVEVISSDNAEPAHARIAVIATGAAVDLPRKLGMNVKEEPDAVAVRQYVRSSHSIDKTIISFDKSLLPGYAWIIPLGDGRYNLGCGVKTDRVKNRQPHLKSRLRAFVESFPEARSLMAQAQAQSHLMGAGLRTALCDDCGPVIGNIICIGETIGTTLPFTGEGIGKAMESAELAAGVIHDALNRSDISCLQEFPALLKRHLLPRYPAYHAAERWLSRPWLNDFMARRIARSPFLRNVVRETLEERGEPRPVFTLANLLRSFWR